MKLAIIQKVAIFLDLTTYPNYQITLDNVLNRTDEFKVMQNQVKKIPMVKGLCSRISLWKPEHQCHGQVIRTICNLALNDLKRLNEKNKMRKGQYDCFIANKFNIETDVLAPICTTRRLDKGLPFYKN